MLENRLSAISLSSVPPDPFSAAPADLCHLVTACVAFDFGLDAAALEGLPRGSQRTAFARQVAMYLAHIGFGLSFESIGHVFGRDRTTVAHACRVVEDARDDIWFDCRVATLELVCRSVGGGVR